VLLFIHLYFISQQQTIYKNQEIILINKSELNLTESKENFDKHATKIQERFAHYLRSYRLIKKITQDDLAKKLGLAGSLIPKLESKHPYPRLISSFLYLKSFADLENIRTNEFVSYLEDGLSVSNQQDWASMLHRVLSKLRSQNQFEFIETIEKLSENMKKLNELIHAFNALAKLEEDDFVAMTRILKTMEKQK
jgi:transcriptional regulator with XRE-family HTH domain